MGSSNWQGVELTMSNWQHRIDKAKLTRSNWQGRIDKVESTRMSIFKVKVEMGEEDRIGKDQMLFIESWRINWEMEVKYDKDKWENWLMENSQEDWVL